MRRVAVSQQRFQLRTRGGAKVRANIITSHARTMTYLTANGNPTSGEEYSCGTGIAMQAYDVFSKVVEPLPELLCGFGQVRIALARTR